MPTTPQFIAVLALLVFAAPVGAQQKPSVYPAKGQSAEQQGRDDAQCLAWAQQSTGIDPAAAAAAPAAKSGPQGERMRGAFRGAAAGALVGEVANDDASHGAAVGATGGALAGGARARRNRAANAEKAQDEKAAALDRYYSAYGACMSGRGYTVG